MSTFKNPQNGYIEEVTKLSGLWAFLFGMLYLAYKGLWAHVFIQMLICLVLYGIVGEPAPLFIFVMWVVYAFITPKLLAARYKRMGWIETSGEPTANAPSKPATDAMGWRLEPAAAETTPAAIISSTPSPASAGTSSAVNELERLAVLRDKGILSPQEFEREKQKVLGRNAAG